MATQEEIQIELREREEAKKREQFLGSLLRGGLGNLIDELSGLKGKYSETLVDNNHPHPETWDKYGGISAYNKMVQEEYKLLRIILIDEINKRERRLNSIVEYSEREIEKKNFALYLSSLGGY